MTIELEGANNGSSINDVDDNNTGNNNQIDNNSDHDKTIQNENSSQDNNQNDDHNSDDNDSDMDDSSSDSEPEQPDWFLKDKFKSTDEQAKAYNELQKKMGKYWGAPKDNYSINDIEGVSQDDPLIANLMPALKDIGLSQDGFATLVKQYQDANAKMMQNYANELKKELTENDVHTYQECDKWMRDNLTEDEIELVQNNWLMTPQDFKLFNILRLKAAPSTNVPSPNGDNTVKFETSKEVTNEKIKYRNELKEGLRVQDKNYENQLASRFRDARARELRGK